MDKSGKSGKIKETKPCARCNGPFDANHKKVNDPYYVGNASYKFKLEDRIILRGKNGKKKVIIYKHVNGSDLCYDCFQELLSND